MWAVIALLGLVAVSCKQDAVFYIISTETAPQKPRIEGGPTNIVVFKDIMYVASGRLHWYAKAEGAEKPQWDSGQYNIKQPKGKISALAATSDRLYAASWDNASIQYIEAAGDAFTRISAGPIQTIYADSEKPLLFAGVGSRNSYDIFYLDNDDTLKPLIRNTSLLSGVVNRDGYYYLSTEGDGIWRVNETNNSIDEGSILQLTDTDATGKKLFMSMIKLEDIDNTIIAVERNRGTLYEVGTDIEGDCYEKMRYIDINNNNDIETDKYAMRALALWEDSQDSTRRALVASIQGTLYNTTTSSHTYGYVEFDLKDGSIDKSFARRDPGKLRSVEDNDRYMTSIGKYPINHLFQAPKNIDPDMTFFASTQTVGLWSYRDRKDGGWQWNAEE